jgi:hypothetical protein
MTKDAYEDITSFYWTDFQKHLTQQIGSDFLASPTMQTINKSVLKFLSQVFPGFFSQNLQHYYQFEYYFNLFSPQETLINTDKYSLSIPTNETDITLFQQLKNNTKLSLPNLRIF